VVPFNQVPSIQLKQAIAEVQRTQGETHFVQTNVPVLLSSKYPATQLKQAVAEVQVSQGVTQGAQSSTPSVEKKASGHAHYSSTSLAGVLGTQVAQTVSLGGASHVAQGKGH
jgi:hypothetical protein